MIQYEIKNPLNAEINEIFINRNTNILSYKDNLGIVFTLLREGDVTPGGEIPTLQQVSDTGGFDNFSTIRQGSFDRFGLNGIETVCSEDKRIQFANGIEYYYPTSDGKIVHANSMNADTPDATYDETQGFQIGSFFNDLKNGKSYICTDATEAAAEWLSMGDDYTSIFTGVSNAISNPLLISSFYTINNGIVDMSILADVDVDFSLVNEGSFTFSLPINKLGNVYGNVTVAAPNQCNGIVLSNRIYLYSDDTTFMGKTTIAANFKYQAY